MSSADAPDTAPTEDGALHAPVGINAAFGLCGVFALPLRSVVGGAPQAFQGGGLFVRAEVVPLLAQPRGFRAQLFRAFPGLIQLADDAVKLVQPLYACVYQQANVQAVICHVLFR